jgi:protein-S-isoprenylcysteine O-methyltransferase Ste14
LVEQLLIVFGVIVFGLQHSGLSALRVKEKIIDRWGKVGYARLFNGTSILALALAFFSMNFWDWLYFATEPEVIQPVLLLSGVVLIALGLVVSAKASQAISVSTVADMRTDRRPELVTDGIYSRIRHPLYLATILLLLGMAAVYPFTNVLVFVLSLGGYVLVGAWLEERKLVVQYGREYLEYRKKAGFILPSLSGQQS